MSAPATIEDQRSKATFKFIEAILPGVEISMDLKAIMSSEQSEFQKIEVIRSVFGKMLVTDGKTQSSEMDEYVRFDKISFVYTTNADDGEIFSIKIPKIVD